MSVKSQSSADTYEIDLPETYEEHGIPKLDEIWGTEDETFVEVDGRRYGLVEVATALDKYKKEEYGGHFGGVESVSQEERHGNVPDREEVVRLLEKTGHLPVD